MTPEAVPPPKGNVTVPVDTVALRLSVSGPLYDSGTLTRPDTGPLEYCGTPLNTCADTGMNNNPIPAKEKSALRRTVFIFIDDSP
jgi:hypothetical protein